MMFAKFLLAHWGKILSVALIGAILWGVWKLYTDNQDLIADIVLTQDQLARCDNTRDRLRQEAAENLRKMQELERQNELHRQEVRQSREEVARIAAERERILRELESIEIPEDVEEKFQWMVDQAMEIRRRREGS